MLNIISGLGAVLFYLAGTFYQSKNLKDDNYQRGKVFLTGGIALLFHLVNIVVSISHEAGYDLGFFHITTLFSFVMVALVLLSSIKKPLENLFLLVFPIAIISILISMVSPATIAPVTLDSTGAAIHIILAVLALSTITLAAFQAAFTALVNYLLKHKQSFQLVSHLPALQTMEALMFEIVWIGLLLLTGVLVTGFIYMDDMFAQHLAHKTFFSIISWCVFAVLLWGRHQLGWRGSRAIRFTITGFVFLVLAYFGSKFVLELLLTNNA